jgi:cytochrome P450
MSTSSEQAAPDIAVDTTTLGAYLGRTPSVESTESSAWPRHKQLTSRYEWYRYMRDERPVSCDPETGIWGIFRYSDVHRALTDVESFSNLLPGAPPDDPLTGTMLRVDPPRHRQLRNLANQAFTSRRISGMRDRIQDLSDALILDGVRDGQIDVVGAVARVLPTQVIGSLLGIDLSLTADFQRWTDAFMQSLMNGADAEQSAILAEMEDYFTTVIDQRRREPGPDLISGAVHAEDEGSHLTDRDVLQFSKLLLIAGSETTTHLITNTVLCLQQDPGLADSARRNPSMMPRIIEEVLRFVAPVQVAPRRARRDVKLYDQVIPADSMVYPWLGSANRDPQTFPAPDQFLLDRTAGQHIGFGYGVHFCIGAVLARLETEVVVTTMLRELPGRWEVPDTVTVYPAHEMCGLSSLPMTWN